MRACVCVFVCVCVCVCVCVHACVSHRHLVFITVPERKRNAIQSPTVYRLTYSVRCVAELGVCLLNPCRYHR